MRFERVILHSDLNNFYASVEEMKNPELKGKPVAVVGSKEDRHGIILAKNMIAKSYGIKTGEPCVQAEKKCPNLVEVSASFPDYMAVSKKVREIYSRFTDKIEPFGIDECWLDVTESLTLFGSGEEIAEKIRNAVKEEIGVTVSIGVSFNKVFAKLGSDLKKPDAVTIISKENYKEIVWKLPVEDLLYVGKSTKQKLNKFGIYTIGDLAKTDKKILVSWLGKWGGYLYTYANGLDDSPVAIEGKGEDIKSIGNSMTNYKDLTTFEEVKTLILLLADSVADRLLESKMGRAKTVKLYVIDNELNTFSKQISPIKPVMECIEIATACYELFNSFYTWKNAVRGVGVSVSNFTLNAYQTDMFTDYQKTEKQERLHQAVYKVRQKYGNKSIRPLAVLKDKRLSELDVKGEHVIHPENNKNNKNTGGS